MTEETVKLPAKYWLTGEEVIDIIEGNLGKFVSFATGFPRLDEELDGGFLKKELVVLGASSGLGKSTVAAQIAYNIARQDFAVAYFSLEISNEMIVSRLIGAIANIKPIRIRMGKLKPAELEQKLSAKAKFMVYAHNMYFYDEVYSLEQIISEIKAHGFDFVVIDFIQNIIGGASDEYSRLSHAALTLQKTAKEANCCIMILSQLSNAAAKADPKSQLLEYKGSGSIATVCDLGFKIDKTEWNNDNKSLDKVNLRLQKNRRGRSGGEPFVLEYRQPGGWISEEEVIEYLPLPEEPPEDTKIALDEDLDIPF